ncbi:MAG: phosphopantetheine-binding protein [Mycoplasmataceae bacterium]|jgi:acyl carrier protein|nr:phosphopantetheine-binding protein [Mycoplasmataceae bacterium]
MKKQDILNGLKEISKERNVKFDENSLNKPFKEIGIDSLTGISMIMDVESKFGITIPDDKLTSIKNYAELIKMIETLIK